MAWVDRFAEGPEMTWVCPTFQRPDGLARLAESWVKCDPGVQLYVRVWEKDPTKEEYFKREWPESWVFYESGAEYAGEALTEFWEGNPEEQCYGFIADDIVLRTPGGLEQLELEAGDWYIAYPNDMLQRHRLCTHFCVGGRLTRTVGYWIPRELRHNYIDHVLMNIGANTGLLRYRPDILFEHMHFLNGKSEKDATNEKIYKGDVQYPNTSAESEGKKGLETFHKKILPNSVKRVWVAMLKEFEGAPV